MMKWALSQLYKNNGKPFTFETTFDFSQDIASIDDILALSEVKVSGTGRHLYGERFMFELHIQAMMTLECAVTLDPIPYEIDLNVTEIFDREDDGQANLIEGNTIDLYQVVWENVYLEKPMRITKFDSPNTQSK
ncbi:MAG: YceD family protein [Bacilli bacterium]|nr:YceD family protein [Bacilli bacterium]